MKNIILFCALLIPSLSFGAQWKVYATSNDGKQVSTIDYDSIKKIKPNIYKVWTNLTDSNLLVETKINNYIDCKNETINHADIYIYMNDTLVNSVTNQKDIMSPPPDSVGWSLIQTVCKAP
ncbi:hypothetical protein OHW97_01775 [Acinetobacter baumannii]|nr:hypothetical protein [Acinetobacter baumannii]